MPCCVDSSRSSERASCPILTSGGVMELVLVCLVRSLRKIGRHSLR